MAKKSILDYFKLNDSSDDDFDDDLFDEDEDDYDEEDTVEDEDDYDEDEDDYYETSKPSKSKSSPLKSFKSYKNSSAGDSTPAKNQRQSHSNTGSGNGKLVSINGRSGRALDDSEVFVIKPDEFDDAQMIIDHLNRGQIIVINMEDLDLPTAQRIADFIGGASYAVDGLFQAISGNIFLATPNGTYVSGDLREELAEGSLQNGSYTSKATY